MVSIQDGFIPFVDLAKLTKWLEVQSAKFEDDAHTRVLESHLGHKIEMSRWTPHKPQAAQQ